MAEGDGGEAEGDEPAGGSDVVYDAAGRIPGAAAPLQRAAGRRGGDGREQPEPCGDGRVDRVLCESAGAADGSRRRAELPGVAEAGEADDVGGVWAPGPAVREVGGGVAAGAGFGTFSFIPGEAGHAKRSTRKIAAAGVGLRTIQKRVSGF